VNDQAKRTAAVAILGLAMLWCADQVWVLVGSILSAEDASKYSPSLVRIVIQAALFAVLFAWFVGPRPTSSRATSFGALVGLLLWVPENLYFFRRLPTFDWDLGITAVTFGVAAAIVLQWALLGYLAARISRLVA